MVLYDIVFSESGNAEAVMEAVRAKLDEMAAKGLLREGQMVEQLLSYIKTSNSLSETLHGAIFAQVMQSQLLAVMIFSTGVRSRKR